ncbi:MAG: hypothetical protein OXD46_06165 [Chloroflexi bacterium]|nr:hypothetical protein [Chloroflexota bacterium]
MREHEVPTHVQAEDRILLWFSFPQIVAITAVCALSYGAYSYAPVGPTGARIGLSVVFGVVGIAGIVGKVGGRSLPLVAADLLRYRLGGRLYAGPVSGLTRSEPPPVPESAPNPLTMVARRAGSGSRRMRLMARRGQAGMRRNRGRRPFRLHMWFGKGRRPVPTKGALVARLGDGGKTLRARWAKSRDHVSRGVRSRVNEVVGSLSSPVFRRTQNIPDVQTEKEDERKLPALPAKTREQSAPAPATPYKRSGRRKRRRKGRGSRERRPERKLVGVVLAFLALTIAAIATPQTVQADGHWLDDIDYEPAEPVPGRRLYFEGLHVSNDRADVALRAATDLKLRVRAYGGRGGSALRFFGIANVAEGEAISYSLPLSGERPSLTFSWEDGIGQAGAFAIEGAQLPFPLPEIGGEICDLRVTSLDWTLGAIEGAVESECAVAVEELVELQTVAGHENVTETAVMEAEVTAVAGTVAVMSGASHASVPFVPDGETTFSLPVATGEAIHPVTIGVDMEAALSVPIPPLVTLTHSPQRAENRTETVTLLRPGTTETLSETVTVTHDDGTRTQHVVSATLSIPSRTVYREVTLTILHPERVEAEVAEREPMTLVRQERLSLHASVGSDDPYAVFTPPQPEPEPERADQSPLTDEEANILFDLWGWGRPW